LADVLKLDLSRRLHPLNALAASLVMLAFVLCAFAIFYLSSDVRREIDELARANGDNTQWSLAQNEIELQSMINAGRVAVATGESLSDFRRRFDIFYSRVQTLRQSGQFRTLRQAGEVASNIAVIQDFLDAKVALIDGEDEALRAALPRLIAEAEALLPRFRVMSLLGIRTAATAADERRATASETLLWIALLTAALVLALTVMVTVLTFMVRQSHQRANEQASTRARLETIIATALDAVIVINRDGQVLEFNTAAEGMFGYSRAEVMGQKMADLIVPEHLKAAHAAGMRRFDTTRNSRILGKARVQMEGQRKDGSTFPIEFSVSLARSTEGEIFVAFLRDISAQLAAEQELVRTRDQAVQGEKAKADFLAVMSHEMRTPLNGMLGTLELLQSTHLDEKQKRYLQVITTSGHLLLHHVNDVLDISRLDAGKMQVRDESFDLNALIQQIVENQRQLAEAKGNRLHWSASDPDLAAVRGDPKRLRQVMLNLVGNAVKFTRNGDVTVTAERLPEGLVELRVIDTGIGISASDQPRIFDDFVTIDASYMRSVGGTGLGLGIARRLVRAMGGQIGLESEVGQGSLFWVRLPLNVGVQPAATVASGTGRKTRPWAGRRVLVVEDNHINRFVAREMLQREHCRVDEAHDGREGVVLAQSNLYDLILMDISMPDLDGVTAALAIQNDPQAQSRQAPIVALTAHALPEDLERFRAAGMVQVLTKPISTGRLRTLLQTVFVGDGAAKGKKAEEPLIKQQVLDQLRKTLGERKFQELLDQFVEQTDRELAQLSSAEISGNAVSMVAAVHKLAGSAAVFGAVALHRDLELLESRLKTGKVKTAATQLAQLQARWAETRALLRLSDLGATG
jgi:PAS domain S-box-containing protein